MHATNTQISSLSKGFHLLSKKKIHFYLQHEMKEEEKTNLPIVDQNHWSEEIE